jgi:hypothetical protein
MWSDSIQLDAEDPEIFNDLFNFYKDEIHDISKEVNPDDETWPLIQEIIKNNNFTTKKPIRNRTEFRERLYSLIEIIKGFSPSLGE